ncbi:MAG: PGPGW domain-containing protein [Actinomycetota bacterium]|nr:PGPGW domain-containing protein [Actinomycetota bacterium]
MTESVKQEWQSFKRDKPGRRFQNRYRRQQAREQGWRDPRRLFFVVGGLVIAIGSLLLGVLPGPGTLTFFLGLAMIAGEFYPVARLLDWAKVRVRKLARRVRGIWRSSTAGKVLVASVAAVCVAAVLYVAYLLLFGG